MLVDVGSMLVDTWSVLGRRASISVDARHSSGCMVNGSILDRHPRCSMVASTKTFRSRRANSPGPERDFAGDTPVSGLPSGSKTCFMPDLFYVQVTWEHEDGSKDTYIAKPLERCASKHAST